VFYWCCHPRQRKRQQRLLQLGMHCLLLLLLLLGLGMLRLLLLLPGCAARLQCHRQQPAAAAAAALCCARPLLLSAPVPALRRCLLLQLPAAADTVVWLVLPFAVAAHVPVA
jgi:hypothetical protein